MRDFKNFTPFEKPEEGLEDFLEDFIVNRRKDVELMADFFEKNQYEDVKKILHKWEGFAEPYGFGGLRHFSSQIRTVIKLHKSELFGKIHQEIKDYLDYKEQSLIAK